MIRKKEKRKEEKKIKNFLEETWRDSFSAKGSSTCFFVMNIAHKKGEKEESV